MHTELGFSLFREKSQSYAFVRRTTEFDMIADVMLAAQGNVVCAFYSNGKQ